MKFQIVFCGAGIYRKYRRVFEYFRKPLSYFQLLRKEK